MKTCDLCGFRTQTGAGLASHRRQRHPTHRGANRRALERLLKTLETAPDPATEQTARSIADTLDADPTNAQMWRTYREVVADLTRGEDAGVEEADELAEIRSLSKVGHLKAL